MNQFLTAEQDLWWQEYVSHVSTSKLRHNIFTVTLTPKVIASCWRATRDPRMLGGDSWFKIFGEHSRERKQKPGNGSHLGNVHGHDVCKCADRQASDGSSPEQVA